MKRRTYGDTINKFVDNLTSFNETSNRLPFNGAMSLLTGISTGLGSSFRIGSSITVDEIDCNLYIANLNPQITFQNMRLILFIWYGSSAPLSSQIVPPSGPGHLLTPYEYSTRDKYEILVDKVYNTVAATSGSLALATPTIFDNFNLKMNHQIDFSDSTSGLGVGDIYQLAIGDTQYAAGFISLSVDVYYRIKFSDY